MKRLIYYSMVVGIVVVCYLLADSLAGVLAVNTLPVAQDTLHQQKIYAYRDWQSVGVQVHANEAVAIRAEGEWLYTPGEYHGPEGHPRYPAPSFYPIAGVPGGILIGKIGETGTPFVVGSYTEQPVRDLPEDGLLYLRINDDLLSDNKGSVVIDITVNETENLYE